MRNDNILRFRFMGKIEIEYLGEDISDRISGKSRALLAILLMNRDKGCSRSSLINYLWPESSEGAARYNLRYNLWQLKKNLDAGDEEEPFIVVTRDECRINENRPYFCDFTEVLDADIESLEDKERLEILAGLYRGEFFENCYYEGCEDLDDMIIMQRYNLERRKLEIFRRLARAYFDEGESELCMEKLGTCEELDPYDEDAAEMKLRLLTDAGRYSEAVNYYNLFAGRLAVDIGVTPSRNLRELVLRIDESAETGTKAVRIEADGIRTVEFYFLSQVLKELMKMPEFNIRNYIDEEQVRDLSAVQRDLGNPKGPVHPARIAESFVSLLCSICSGGRTLTLALRMGDGIDETSSAIISLVQEKCGGRLMVESR